jgi:hypothetical protein
MPSAIMREPKPSLEERQLEAMWNYLAFVPRDRRLKLSAQLARDFDKGNRYASHVVHSGIFKNCTSASPLPAVEAATPLASVAVLAQPKARIKAARAEATKVAISAKRRQRKGKTPAWPMPFSRAAANV